MEDKRRDACNLRLLCYRNAPCRTIPAQAAFFAKWAADWVSVQGYDGTNNLPNTVSSCSNPMLQGFCKYALLAGPTPPHL